jgi:DNA-binding transcriptional regulator LsrR (DeoR family)
MEKKSSLNGENNPNSKLTEKEVLEIRDLYKTGNFTMLDLGERYGINRRSISAIINKERWIHI